jgi:ABC-2 type transport system permease protein
MNDARTMTKRCLLLSLRSPDTLLTSVVLPALLMFLFVALFGGILRIEGVSYVNYIVPGVLLQCIGQCASTTAIGVNRDLTNGMALRFCTLPVKPCAVLSGRLWEAVLRNMLTSAIVLLAAVPAGFRPNAGAVDWLIVLVMLTGVTAAVSWLAVYIGICADSAEGASALSAVVVVLPYLSSGFVPTGAMPKALALFARYQPMTPVIDTMRNAFWGKTFEPAAFAAALLWCIVLSAAFCLLSRRAFLKRVRK